MQGIPAEQCARYIPSPIVRVSPMQIPSKRPTLTPTLVPSLNPSSPPTWVPTRTPTLLPSLMPSGGPTNRPTLVPSRSPSKVKIFILLDPLSTRTTWYSCHNGASLSGRWENYPACPAAPQGKASPHLCPPPPPALCPRVQVPSSFPTGLPTRLPTGNPTVNPSKVLE